MDYPLPMELTRVNASFYHNYYIIYVYLFQESIPFENKKADNLSIIGFRAPPGARTLDTLIKSQVLYQLS